MLTSRAAALITDFCSCFRCFKQFAMEMHQIHDFISLDGRESIQYEKPGLFGSCLYPTRVEN